MVELDSLPEDTPYLPLIKEGLIRPTQPSSGNDEWKGQVLPA